MAKLSKIIENLDLDSVIIRMKRDAGLSTEQIQQAITEYKQFLELRLTSGEDKIVPTEMADKAWHYHILDTKKYAADCDNIFGEFMDHDPNPTDMLAFNEATKSTSTIWKEKFGADAPNTMTSSICW